MNRKEDITPKSAMEAFRRGLANAEEEMDKELFEKIKENPHPDILDLWNISERRFIEWRKLHDLPRLLVHFDKVLPEFKEWKESQKLSDEIILKGGRITPFLERKKGNYDSKSKFHIKQIIGEEEYFFVGYESENGQKNELGKTFTLDTQLEFVAYEDWMLDKGVNVNIFYINSRSSPNTEKEKVFIHNDIYKPNSDFELLKMGGVFPPKEHKVLNRAKYLEFVNLCGLSFEGEYFFGNKGNLNCSYCTCDNWKLLNVEMSSVGFNHCTFTNLELVNTKIQHWSMYDCTVTGDFVNSKLYNSKFIDGRFMPVFSNCTLSNTHLFKDKSLAMDNQYGLRLLKKTYESQGDDDISKTYYILENEAKRESIKGWNWSFITKSISYYYWQYGNKPHRIIYLSLAIIMLFALAFFLNPTMIALNSSAIKGFDFWDSLYFSTVTFTTLGYGDYSPNGWLKILCSIEAFSGVINMGFIIAGYSNTKY